MAALLGQAAWGKGLKASFLSPCLLIFFLLLTGGGWIPVNCVCVLWHSSPGLPVGKEANISWGRLLEQLMRTMAHQAMCPRNHGRAFKMGWVKRVIEFGNSDQKFLSVRVCRSLKEEAREQ